LIPRTKDDDVKLDDSFDFSRYISSGILTIFFYFKKFKIFLEIFIYNINYYLLQIDVGGKIWKKF